MPVVGKVTAFTLATHAYRDHRSAARYAPVGRAFVDLVDSVPPERTRLLAQCLRAIELDDKPFPEA